MAVSTAEWGRPAARKVAGRILDIGVNNLPRAELMSHGVQSTAQPYCPLRRLNVTQTLLCSHKGLRITSASPSHPCTPCVLACRPSPRPQTRSSGHH